MNELLYEAVRLRTRVARLIGVLLSIIMILLLSGTPVQAITVESAQPPLCQLQVVLSTAGEHCQIDLNPVYAHLPKPTIQYQSDKPHVATVDKKGHVTATGFGICTITISTADGQTGTCEITVANKRIALTFDDGPHATYTPMMLDALAKRRAKATFYLIGQEISKNRKLLIRMMWEGHEIGNHTYSHQYAGKTTAAAYTEQVQKANDMIMEVTGMTPRTLRPPGGDVQPFVRRQGMPLVLWSVDPKDWQTKDALKIYQNVMATVKDGDIVLLHDRLESTVEACGRLMDTLMDQGYRFVTVSELIPDMQDGSLYTKAPKQ